MRAWLHSWWLRVPMPREFSVVFTIVYVIALDAGISTLREPPLTLSNQLGSPLYIMSVGLLLLVGSLVAMAGGAFSFWWLERIGLWFMGGASVIYASVVISLQLTASGSRRLQLAYIVLGIVLFIVRWLFIRRFTFQPGGRAWSLTA